MKSSKKAVLDQTELHAPTTEINSQSKPAFVYMVLCADNTLYTGWTFDPTARLATHNAGKGAKYTRARLPVALVYTEQLPDEKAARRREVALKQLTRPQKLALIAQQKSRPV